MLDRAAWQARFRKILSLDNHPRHIAVGFAVGVFISITPFFGLHTPLAIAAAFIFRLNKLTCITGAWVNTPITIIPLLIASHKLGTFMLGRPQEAFNIKEPEWEVLRSNAAELLLGSSMIGFAAAISGYFLCYWMVVRFRRKDEVLAELTREMEETGEEIE